MQAEQLFQQSKETPSSQERLDSISPFSLQLLFNMRECSVGSISTSRGYMFDQKTLKDFCKRIDGNRFETALAQFYSLQGNEYSQSIIETQTLEFAIAELASQNLIEIVQTDKYNKKEETKQNLFSKFRRVVLGKSKSTLVEDNNEVLYSIPVQHQNAIDKLSLERLLPIKEALDNLSIPARLLFVKTQSLKQNFTREDLYNTFKTLDGVIDLEDIDGSVLINFDALVSELKEKFLLKEECENISVTNLFRMVPYHLSSRIEGGSSTYDKSNFVLG
jgi:hypothetical protein